MIKKDIGFYLVDGKAYSNKLEAVLTAQKTNSSVEWNFFDEVFENINWTQEPELSLDKLYAIRAQQIRDQYDYVIVFCSGGADSTNVIRTFIKNGIKVDEVIGLAPMSGLTNWKFNNSNVADINTISEIKYAMFPLFEEISKENIKISIYDYFEDILKYKDEEWSFESCGNIVTSLTAHFTKIEKFKHLDQLIQSGKKIALVYGTDKPDIRIPKSGDLVFVFGDGGVNYLNMPNDRSYPNVDRVLFYWSPNLPDIVVKQAHVVARALFLPEFENLLTDEIMFNSDRKMLHFNNFQDVSSEDTLKQKQDILKTFIKNKKNYYILENYDSYRTIYQRNIVPYIYPTTYDENLFQCQKVDVMEGFFTRDQDWLHVLHWGTKMSEMVLEGSKSLYKSILPKYLNYKGTGFPPMRKIYKFGNISKFKS